MRLQSPKVGRAELVSSFTFMVYSEGITITSVSYCSLLADKPCKFKPDQTFLLLTFILGTVMRSQMQS